ncbi:MAG: hypothetical protein KatS3mg110_0267 [Pirellulaceae bacterium]|nr:MAG: hypothetical protein KatS3mg110_0267 [Pirellulaceae bacterium]
MWTGVLVMALTAPSVEYGWQAGTDGQLEYIIELEDIAIAALRAGKEVSSDIHPDVVRSVRRFVARAERPQPARPTVAPRNDSQPAAQYGWKPGADGQLEYYIQLNSAALDAVERGQEISGNIHPEVAGKVKRLVLRLGDQPLPRISPPPERTPPPNRAEPSAPASTLPANPPPIDWGGWFTYGLNRELPGAAVPPGAVAHSYPQNTTDSRWSEPPSGGVSCAKWAADARLDRIIWARFGLAPAAGFTVFAGARRGRSIARGPCVWLCRHGRRTATTAWGTGVG